MNVCVHIIVLHIWWHILHNVLQFIANVPHWYTNSMSLMRLGSENLDLLLIF